MADAFWADHPDEFIAIHCAYGTLRHLLIYEFLLTATVPTLSCAVMLYFTGNHPVLTPDTALNVYQPCLQAGCPRCRRNGQTRVACIFRPIALIQPNQHRVA